MPPIMILGAMGAVFGVGLALTSKAFEVKSDPRAALIRESLPGVNCAACGYTGCDGFAAAVAAGEAAPNLCPVGGPAVAAKIGEIMGTEVGEMEKNAARVHCAGYIEIRSEKYEYDGIKTCAAASATALHGGPSSCRYGCLGFGDCARACAYGAVFVRDGIAGVIASRCTACGLCAKACPKKLISLEPARASYAVLCKNKDRGAVARAICAASCIGCMRCLKACQAGAITVADSLASIDQSKCVRCGECERVCPQRSIAHCDCLKERELEKGQETA